MQSLYTLVETTHQCVQRHRHCERRCTRQCSRSCTRIPCAQGRCSRQCTSIPCAQALLTQLLTQPFLARKKSLRKPLRTPLRVRIAYAMPYATPYALYKYERVPVTSTCHSTCYEKNAYHQLTLNKVYIAHTITYPS